MSNLILSALISVLSVVSVKKSTTTKSKTMSRKINQSIARADRKRRQKYSGRKLNRCLTSGERKANRRHKAQKLAARAAAQIRYQNWLATFAHPSQGKTIITTTRVVVTPPTLRTGRAVERPVTLAVKSDATRAGNSRFQLASGGEAPVAHRGKFATMRNADPIPASVAFRRDMANGEYDNSRDGQSALSKLYGGIRREHNDYVPTWVHEEEDCWDSEPAAVPVLEAVEVVVEVSVATEAPAAEVPMDYSDDQGSIYEDLLVPSEADQALNAWRVANEEFEGMFAWQDAFEPVVDVVKPTEVDITMCLDVHIESARLVPIVVDNEHPSCSFMPYAYKWDDEDGYPQYEANISINEEVTKKLADLLHLSYEDTLEMSIAHERGHAVAHYLGQDIFDEVLAWSYATYFTDLDFTVLREYCLGTYKGIKQGQNGLVELVDGWIIKRPKSTKQLENELFIYEWLTRAGCAYIAEYDATTKDVVKVKYLEGYVSFKDLTSEQRDLAQPYAFTALQTLHKCGVLHTDANLNNIFIRLDDNDVKIIDFGESELCDDSAEFRYEVRMLVDCFNYFRVGLVRCNMLRLEVLSPVTDSSEVFGKVIEVRNPETEEQFTLGCAHCCKFTKEQYETADRLEGCYTPSNLKDDPRMLFGYHPNQITTWNVDRTGDQVFIELDVAGVPDYNNAGRTTIELNFPGRLNLHRNSPTPNLRLLERLWRQVQQGREEEQAIRAFYRILGALCAEGRIPFELGRLAAEQVVNASDDYYLRFIGACPIIPNCEEYYRCLVVVCTDPEAGYAVASDRINVNNNWDVLTPDEYWVVEPAWQIDNQDYDLDMIDHYYYGTEGLAFICKEVNRNFGGFHTPWDFDAIELGIYSKLGPNDTWSWSYFLEEDCEGNYLEYETILVTIHCEPNDHVWYEMEVKAPLEHLCYAPAVLLTNRPQVSSVVDVVAVHAQAAEVINRAHAQYGASDMQMCMKIEDSNPTGMVRFHGWRRWLQDNFDVVINVIDRNDYENYGTARKYLNNLNVNGTFQAPRTIYVVNQDSPARMTKTLFHEFGHFLVYNGYMSLKGNDFVRKYFRQIPKAWIATYSRWQREEEVVVECFARWALDLETDRSLNATFKQYLLTAKAEIGVVTDAVVDYVAFEHGVPEQGTTAGNTPASPTSDAVNQQMGVKKVESKLGHKELTMLNNLIECFPNTKTVASIGNSLAYDKQHILGYATYLVPLMRNDDGEVIPCNLNLPVRQQFSHDGYLAALGTPDVVDDEYKLNHTGLGNMMGDSEPVLVFAGRSYRKGASTCSGFFFGTQGWYRNVNIRNSQVQLIFNELNDVEGKATMTAHVDVEVTQLVTSSRRKMKDLLLDGGSRAFGFNTIQSEGLLAAMPEANKRYWFVVVAEVNGVHSFGQPSDQGAEFDPKFKQRQLNVDMVDGKVVGDVKNDKKVIQSRFYCNHMTFLAVAEPNVMFDPDAVTHYNSNYYEAVVETLYGDNFLRRVETLKGGFFASEFTTMKVVGDPRLDLNDNSRLWLIDGVEKGFRNGAPTMKPFVNIDKPVVVEQTQAPVQEVIPTPEVPVTKEETSPVITTSVVSKIESVMADELKAYYESMTSVDSKSLNDSINWEDFTLAKFASWVSSNTVTKSAGINLNYGLRPAAYACHCYLAACIGVDYTGNLPLLSGYVWEAKHFEGLVNIIRSYMDAEDADQVIKFVDGAINIEDSTLVYLLDDIGVIDVHRDRMFKGVIDVVWENKKEKGGTIKVIHEVIAASSYGAFMRFFYYGYIALLSGKLMNCMTDRNIGANLSSFHTKYDKYFPITSDGTVNMTGPTIHAESCGFNIVGTQLTTEVVKTADGKEVEVQVVHKPELMEVVDGKLKVKDFAGAGAEKLTLHYGGYRLRGEIKDTGMLEQVIFNIAEAYSMGFSFNKGTGLRGDLVHVDCGRLAQHAPKWYARLQKRVAKLGYSGSLEGFFVNLNTKSEKGSKRILLRAATSVPSGCVIDVEERPLLAAALANGRGVKYDNQAARTVAPGFYGVEGGYKSYTQKRPLIGTAQRVALGMTIIGPAGEAWHLTGKNHRPTGFVTKKMSYKSSMYKRGVGLHIDTGTILMGCGYNVTQESQYGVNYTYYRPQVLQSVGCGAVLAHVDTGVVLENGRPYLRAVKQTRDVEGYLEWVRTYEVCSMSNGKNNQQLVVEWAITWKEDQAKIRSSVAKGMTAFVKKEFLFNSDNPGVTERLVDIVYPQDVIKADTLNCFIPIIGHTLVLNPDCTNPEFLWMVNRAMDINLAVEGRRHLDYLVECPVAIADGLYDELQQRFCAFFGRQITVDWQQLGNADHGDAMLALYQADVKAGNKFDVSNVKHINSNSHVVAIADVDLNDPANIGTPAEMRANIFWFYMNPDRTKVLRYKQRGWALVGREDCDCPIYDVVLFESSTVKEAAGESTQLGSSMRSNYRLMGCETIRDIMMGQAVKALEQPYRAKLLCATYDGSMNNAGNEVINLCSWTSKKHRGETVWEGVPNQEGLARVRQLLAGIDLNDPENNLLFEQICFALRNVVLRIQTNGSRALKANHLTAASSVDEEGYYEEESVIKVGHFDVYTPLLFNLNALKSGDESLDTMSGMFFYQYLIVLLAGQLPNAVDVNRIRGKLKALVESGNTAKNINGDTLVGGKAIALPNIPTNMLLLSDSGRQYDLMKRHVRQYEHATVDGAIKHNLDKDCPSFAKVVSQGLKAYSNPVFNHETRMPMPDGPVLLVTLLPNTVKDLSKFYYAPSDLEFVEYLDGVPVLDKDGNPVVRVDNVYPDVRISSAVAHNLMTAGDDDGDGTYGAILPWATEEQKQRLLSSLTTLEYALNFRASAVGFNEGETAYDVMLRKECYWGDYMMTKNGFSRYKIVEQLGSYIRVGSKGAAIQHSTKSIDLYQEKDGVIVTAKDKDGKLQPVSLGVVVSYSAINARAREVFSTMVGVSYGIYQMAEAIVDIVTGLKKADVEVHRRFRWATKDNAYLVVSAVAEIYETILGAYTPAVWTLWKSFVEKTAKPKVGEFGVKLPNYVTQEQIPAFTKAIEGIGCNGSLAVPIADCFNILADVKCWEKGNLGGGVVNSKLGQDKFVMYVALAQFEMGRGKWVGYMKGYLNGANEWDENKTACHQTVTTQLFHWFALNMGINGEHLPEAAFEHSHVLWVMRKLFQPEVMGDVCQYQPGAGYIFANTDGARPAMDYFRYKLEQRTGKQEDNTMELSPVVDVTADVVVSNPVLETVQEITWVRQAESTNNESDNNDQDDDGGINFYDSDMPECPDDDGYCSEEEYNYPDIEDDGQVMDYHDDGEEVSTADIAAAIATATPAPAPTAVTSESVDSDDDGQILDYEDDGEEVSTADIAVAITGKPAPVVEPTVAPEPVVVVQQQLSPVVDPLAYVASNDQALAEFKAKAAAIAKRKSEEQAYVKRLAEAKAVVENLRAQFGDDAVAELLAEFGGTDNTNGSCSDDKDEPEEPTGGVAAPKPQPKPNNDGGAAVRTVPVEKITTAADSISHESAEPTGAVCKQTSNKVEDNKKQELIIVPEIKEATPVVQTPVKQETVTPKVTYTPGNYTSCQQKFMDLIASGSNVFLTGKAGTGKTFITSECIHRWAAAGDKVVAFGTTGISVMNLAGNLEDEAVEALGTVNSGFALGIAFGEHRPRNENDWQWANKLIAEAKVNTYVKQNLTCKAGQRLRVVIDEVSMLDARLLYIVMEIIKYYNPFAQVLLVGDGGQLPVVGDDAVKFYKQAVIDGYLGTLPYMFGDFKVVELQTGVRQKDDLAFEQALDHLRETGEVTGVILERFKQCVEGLKPSNPDDVTYIYFNNKRVEDINERRTAEMTTTKRVYKGQVIRKAANNDNWVRDFRPIPVELTLAISMPVKLRVNIYKIVDSKKVLVAANGSRGRVTKLANDYVEVDFGDGKPLAIGVHEFVGRRLPNGSLTGKFIQLPLHADFATTINSCQGLTLTNPGVCGVFEDVKGQTVALTREAALYVMLSRFTKIEDVYFDVSDSRAVNWFINSQGYVDKAYFAWLKANRH